jgi:hypothetical protein
MKRSWLLLMVHSLLNDIISYLLVGLPTTLRVCRPTCCQGHCEDTCAISAASFIADFWILNGCMVMAVNSELNWLNIGSGRSSFLMTSIRDGFMYLGNKYLSLYYKHLIELICMQQR